MSHRGRSNHREITGGQGAEASPLSEDASFRPRRRAPHAPLAISRQIKHWPEGEGQEHGPLLGDTLAPPGCLEPSSLSTYERKCVNKSVGMVPDGVLHLNRVTRVTILTTCVSNFSSTRNSYAQLSYLSKNKLVRL